MNALHLIRICPLCSAFGARLMAIVQVGRDDWDD